MADTLHHINPENRLLPCEGRMKGGNCKWPEAPHFEDKVAGTKEVERRNAETFGAVPGISKKQKAPVTAGFDKENRFEFQQPDIDSAYLEDDVDGEYYRFEQMAWLFEEFEPKDVVPGYTMNANLKSLQRFVNDDVVNYYQNTKNPFAPSLANTEEQSFPMVAIIKNVPYIVDGNHRFAAAKERNMSAFAAVVIEFSDDGEDYFEVYPDEFNARFNGK